MSANLSGGKDTDMWTVSQHNPKKQKVCMRQRSDMEKLICNPSQTNKEHKNEWALIPAHLEVNQDQDVIQIDNNMETPCSGKGRK